MQDTMVYRQQEGIAYDMLPTLYAMLSTDHFLVEGAYNLADLPTEALNCEEVQPICSSPTFPDQYWLQRWIHLISTSSHTPRVLLIVTAWQHLLLGHSHRDLVHFLLTGLSQGFRLGYTQTTSTLKSASCNMHSALLHPEVVDQYLPAELAEHRVVGPYPKSALSEAHVSRFGVIPKGVVAQCSEAEGKG